MTGEILLCKLTDVLDETDESKIADELSLILADIPRKVDITKKQTAIIVHEFLRRVLHEEDEKDVSKASVLKDLYDCRICVKHIEQVYVKGIMTPMIDIGQAKERNLPVIFGGNELLTDDEAELIVKRTVNKGLRIEA